MYLIWIENEEGLAGFAPRDTGEGWYPTRAHESPCPSRAEPGGSGPWEKVAKDRRCLGRDSDAGLQRANRHHTCPIRIDGYTSFNLFVVARVTEGFLFRLWRPWEQKAPLLNQGLFFGEALMYESCRDWDLLCAFPSQMSVGGFLGKAGIASRLWVPPPPSQMGARRLHRRDGGGGGRQREDGQRRRDGQGTAQR